MRRLAAAVYDGFELLDLFGPLEMFGLRPDLFDLQLTAAAPGSVRSAQGPRVIVDATFEEARAVDLLLVPGGPGARLAIEDDALLDWIAARAETAELTMSVCTGAAILARAGVLDGRAATTNKAAWEWTTAQGPQVTWRPHARWVVDGPVFTSAGVAAGIDMALAAIARLQGDSIAEEIAAAAEYQRRVDPADDPFAARYGLA